MSAKPIFGIRPIVDIGPEWHRLIMRVAVVSLLLLSACGTEAPKQCAEGFCLPSQSKLLGKQEVEDFNLYQVEWNGERFSIYAGNAPNFEELGSKPIAIPLDTNAKLRTNDK